MDEWWTDESDTKGVASEGCRDATSWTELLALPIEMKQTSKSLPRTISS